MMPNNTTQNTDDKKKTSNDSLDDKLYEHNFMFSSLRECHVFFLFFSGHVSYPKKKVCETRAEKMAARDK